MSIHELRAHRVLTAAAVLSLLFAISCSDSGKPEHWNDGLEEGVNYGLAAAYPDDEGIEDDPHVIAAEGFETGTVTLPTQEDRLVNGVEVVDSTAMSGRYSAKFTWHEGDLAYTTRFVLPDWAYEGIHSTYFVRVCYNYDRSFHPIPDDAPVGVKGFGIVADPYREMSTNNPPDGYNWFNAQVQFVGWGPSAKPQANDGFLWVGHQYSYNPAPEKAVAEVGILKISDPAVGDRPYRFSAYADPFYYIRFNEWHCYEVGMYLNTPGIADGEARFWIDGVLQTRITHMKYRDDPDLIPNHIHINFYRTTPDFPQDMVRWMDDIVIATRYIGPVVRSR